MANSVVYRLTNQYPVLCYSLRVRESAREAGKDLPEEPPGLFLEVGKAVTVMPLSGLGDFSVACKTRRYVIALSKGEMGCYMEYPLKFSQKHPGKYAAFARS